MSHVEANVSRASNGECDRLSMRAGHRRYLLTCTAEPVTDDGACSGTVEDKHDLLLLQRSKRSIHLTVEALDQPAQSIPSGLKSLK